MKVVVYLSFEVWIFYLLEVLSITEFSYATKIYYASLPLLNPFISNGAAKPLCQQLIIKLEFSYQL